jgi:hypothetical protein
MSDIIYTPPASSGGGTTINPTNNRIPKRQNATTFADSVLENGTNYLYSNYGGYTGLGLDFLNFVSYLGDWNNLINGTSFVINDATQNIYTKYNGFVNGINIDFVNSNYQFGNIGNNTAIILDDPNQLIQFNIGGNQIALFDQLNNVTDIGYGGSMLQLRQGNNNCYLGDYNFTAAGNYLSIDNSSGNQISTVSLSFGGNYGLLLNFGSNAFTLGDRGFLNNGTYIYVEDSSAKLIEANCKDLNLVISDTLNFNGASLQSNTASGNSGEHLVIYLNGIQYKIKLENP